MSQLCQRIQDVLRDICTKRQDILTFALTQQKGFEGWLKWELAAALHGQGLAVEVEKLEGEEQKGKEQKGKEQEGEQ
ncbi:MAG: hypothetical protein NZ951_03290 [Dehalococcoidia bacterium]|nr:hypothetical protein [Dehalococcoidia bacterium]